MGIKIPKIGTKAGDPSPAIAPTALADVLFTPVQQRVLGLLFGQPERRYQSAELIRMVSSGTGSVHRLLTRLAQVGLVTVESVGNQKFYQANPRAPVFEELTGLLRKTSGLVVPIRNALAPFASEITAAFVYGSVAKGNDHAGSDIDLLVLADGLDYSRLVGALHPVETALARELSPNLMTPDEWRRKRMEGGFAARVAAQPKLFVFGSDDDIG